MIYASFSAYQPSTTSALSTFKLLLDDNQVIGESSFYFNHALTHLTIPSIFAVVPSVSRGPHSLSIRIPEGVAVDGNDHASIIVSTCPNSEDPWWL